MTWLTTLLKGFAKPFQWWVVVAPWEQGIRVRLGKSARRLDPGIHFRLPFLDRVYVQSIRLRTLWETGQTLTTKDGQTLTLSIATHFNIRDIVQLYNAMALPDTTIRTQVASRIAEYVSTHNRNEITVASVEAYMAENPIADGAGITTPRVNVTSIAFARTYRIMLNDYQHNSGLYDIESEEGNGER